MTLRRLDLENDHPVTVSTGRGSIRTSRPAGAVVGRRVEPGIGFDRPRVRPAIRPQVDRTAPYPGFRIEPRQGFSHVRVRLGRGCGSSWQFDTRLGRSLGPDGCVRLLPGHKSNLTGGDGIQPPLISAARSRSSVRGSGGRSRPRAATEKPVLALRGQLHAPARSAPGSVQLPALAASSALMATSPSARGRRRSSIPAPRPA